MSSTCFEHRSVHPQEDLYMQFYGISFMPCIIILAWKKYRKTACTSLPEDEHFDVRNISKTLTYSTVQSPSWEANWFAASQEIPHISRNPKVHYRTHKSLPPVSILDQPNPVHIPTSHLLEIYPNIIHPSTPRSPQWSLSLRFPHQDPIHPPLLTHTRHMLSRRRQYN